MWQSFLDWLQQPFKSDMDTFHWFLFIGLVIIAAFAWRQLVLRHILEATETLG